MPENTTNTSKTSSRPKVLTNIVTGLLGTATAGTVTATKSDGRATTAGGGEVNKNEILFAQRELPHYLNETILNGNTRVTVTRSGERPPRMDLKNIDVTLSKREHRQVLDSAISEYVDKFGVDPSAPKVQITDGKPYTNEEAQKLVERETIDPGKVESEQSARPQSPHPIDGTVRVHMMEAADEQHRPHEAWFEDSTEAWDRFSAFGPTTRVSVYYGYWKPEIVGKKSKPLLEHLVENQSDKREDSNHLVAGWVDHATNNGRARIDGHYSVSATSADFLDWPHDSIFQHELSHNFGAVDEVDGIGCINPTCIMNYAAARAHETEWCGGCHSDVDSHMS